MNQEEIKRIAGELGHLYLQMKQCCEDSAGAKRLADGLLSPQIKRLENLIKEEE